jgi:hypothetical protein
MSSDSDEEVPEIPIVCSACETRSYVPFPDVEETVARHNENLHDGDPIAQVDPDVMDELADRVARDIGLFEE